MAKKSKKQQQKGGVIENPEAIAEKLSRSEEFLAKNRNLVIGVLVAVVVAIGGYFFFSQNMTEQEEEAQIALFQPIIYFEADSLNKALDGDGNSYGLLEIIDDFGGTDAANLANYYAGAAYLKQGQYEDAIDHLSSFSSSDLLVQPRAYALIGDAYMEMGNYVSASDYYERAGNASGSKEFAPSYYLKAALAFEKRNEMDEAVRVLEKIINDYPEATEIAEARKQKARLSLLAS